MHTAQRAGMKVIPVGDHILLVPNTVERTRGVLIPLDGTFVGGILMNLTGWFRRDLLGWHLLHASTLASSLRTHPN